MRKILFLSSLLSLCLLSSEAFAATHSVQMNDLSFQPQTITIDQGDSVKWNNIDAALYGGIFHTVTSGTNCTYDGTGWDSGTVALGRSFQATFNVPGAYPYFCRLHCLSTGMTGTVIVNPVTMSLPPAQEFISYAPVSFPVVSADPLQAMPLSIGGFADGGPIVTIRLTLSRFSGPVDVYAAFSVASDQSAVHLLKPDLTLQTMSVFEVSQALAAGAPPSGVEPFIQNILGTVDLPDLMSMSASDIAPGTYTIYILTAPSGTLQTFYLWQTTVLVP